MRGRRAPGSAARCATGARFLVVVSALALVLGACTGSSREPSTSPARAGGAGHLISERAIRASAEIRAWRVLYSSRSISGAPIRVSGVVVAPRSPAPPGGYPIVSWAHGIVGLADHCAPSRQRPLVGHSVPAIHLASLGWVIAATDYEGLGTPGPHPTAVGVSEGRGVLDITRAVGEMPQLQTRNDVVVFGHSEGGQAALFAGQLAPSYAPELHIVGVIASAPAAELTLLTRELPANGLLGYLVEAAVAYRSTYPGLSLERVLTPWALARVPSVRRTCAAEVLQTFDVPASQVFRRSPLAVAPWPSLLARNTPGRVPVDSPVLVLQGRNDPTIPPQAVRALGRELCAAGDDVLYREYAGVGHEPIATAAPDIFAWVQGRLAGLPPPTSCGTPSLA
ncbi:MAG: lipase family protein [Actinomycetota bacterium]|nr:lipase family protein [Actinomycetota bacterium]